MLRTFTPHVGRSYKRDGIYVCDVFIHIYIMIIFWLKHSGNTSIFISVIRRGLRVSLLRRKLTEMIFDLIFNNFFGIILGCIILPQKCNNFIKEYKRIN